MNKDYSPSQLHPARVSKKTRSNPVRYAGTIVQKNVLINGPLTASSFLPKAAKTNSNGFVANASEGIVSKHFIDNASYDNLLKQFDLVNNPTKSGFPGETVYKTFDSNAPDPSEFSNTTLTYLMGDIPNLKKIDFNAAVEFTNNPLTDSSSRNTIRLVELGNTLSNRNGSQRTLQDNRIRFYVDDANRRILAQIGSKGKSNTSSSAYFNESNGLVDHYTNETRTSLNTTLDLQKAVKEGFYNQLLGISPDGSGKEYQLIIQNLDGNNDFATVPLSFEPKSTSKIYTNLKTGNTFSIHSSGNVKIEDNRTLSEFFAYDPALRKEFGLNSASPVPDTYDPKEIGIDMSEIRQRIANELYRRRGANPSSVPYELDIDDFAKSLKIYFLRNSSIMPPGNAGTIKNSSRFFYKPNGADPSLSDITYSPQFIFVNPEKRGGGFFNKEKIFFTILHEAGHAADKLHNDMLSLGLTPVNPRGNSPIYFPRSVNDDVALNHFIERFYSNDPKLTGNFTRLKRNYNRTFLDPSKDNGNYIFNVDELYANDFSNSALSSVRKTLLRSPGFRSMVNPLDERAIEDALINYEVKLNSKLRPGESTHNFSLFSTEGPSAVLPVYYSAYDKSFGSADSISELVDLVKKIRKSDPNRKIDLTYLLNNDVQEQLSTKEYADILKDRALRLASLDDIFLMFGHKEGGKIK